MVRIKLTTVQIKHKNTQNDLVLSISVSLPLCGVNLFELVFRLRCYCAYNAFNSYIYICIYIWYVRIVIKSNTECYLVTPTNKQTRKKTQEQIQTHTKTEIFAKSKAMPIFMLA